jgi:hypothetical protein
MVKNNSTVRSYLSVQTGLRFFFISIPQPNADSICLTVPNVPYNPASVAEHVSKCKKSHSVL